MIGIAVQFIEMVLGWEKQVKSLLAYPFRRSQFRSPFGTFSSSSSSSSSNCCEDLKGIKLINVHEKSLSIQLILVLLCLNIRKQTSLIVRFTKEWNTVLMNVEGSPSLEYSHHSNTVRFIFLYFQRIDPGGPSQPLNSMPQWNKVQDQG